VDQQPMIPKQHLANRYEATRQGCRRRIHHNMQGNLLRAKRRPFFEPCGRLSFRQSTRQNQLWAECPVTMTSRRIEGSPEVLDPLHAQLTSSAVVLEELAHNLCVSFAVPATEVVSRSLF
jgi:hypothetical protein